MGVDIVVYRVEKSTGKIKVKKSAGKIKQICVTQDYLSGNFYYPCWNIHEEMEGQTGEQVAEKLRLVLDNFRKNGYITGKPDILNENWAYGHKDNIIFDEPTSTGVFMFHLERFLKLAETYHDCYFLSDNDSTKDTFDATVILPSGDLYTIKYFDDNENEDEDESYAIAYFRHPTKGNFRVDTQKKCLEVFGILSAQGDSRAQAWFDIYPKFKPE
jgi:hypothetical protein